MEIIGKKSSEVYGKSIVLRIPSASPITVALYLLEQRNRADKEDIHKKLLNAPESKISEYSLTPATMVLIIISLASPRMAVALK